MIPLFSRHALTRAQAEELLGRALTGDPSHGERAAIAALAALDFEEARAQLASSDVGDDFRALVSERLDAAVRRGDKHFVVSVMVSGNAYDHYARQARVMGLDISAALAASVERDFARLREQAVADAEPATRLLARYVAELVALLKRGDDDPQLGARLTTLRTLAGDLEERAAALGRAGEPS